MDAGPMIGLILYVLGGAVGAIFYLPFKKITGWAWESYWLVYSVAALLVVPWAFAFAVAPNFIEALKATPTPVLLKCFIFGAMWGFGGLTWGLMIRYLGVGLGLALGCGLCAASGTLIPPMVDGTFGTLFNSLPGQVTLAGVGVSLLGIIAVGAAGMSKEGEMSEEQKKASVAEFNFRKGVAVAIFSGLMSSALNFGLQGGKELQGNLATLSPPTPEMWQGIPVIAVVLLGGFLVNFLWCLMLNAKNGTFGDYLKPAPSKAFVNFLLAGLAGVIWYSQFAFFKVGDAKIGSLAFAGWAALMSSQILFSTLLAVALKEWKGVSSRTIFLLVLGLGLLVGSMATIGAGSKIQIEEQKAAAYAPPL